MHGLKNILSKHPNKDLDESRAFSYFLANEELLKKQIFRIILEVFPDIPDKFKIFSRDEFFENFAVTNSSFLNYCDDFGEYICIGGYGSILAGHPYTGFALTYFGEKLLEISF